MDVATYELVRHRAGNVCEYCQLPQATTPLVTFHVEHIVAKQHVADDSDANLALACDRCNAYKGPNLTSVDPESGSVVPLYHPRRETWSVHFRFEGARIVGSTASGRATVRLLNMNASRRLELREEWLREGGVFGRTEL